MKKGSLVVVGTGIRTVGQMTTEAIAWLKLSDKVLYVVNDPIAVETIKLLNPSGAESLSVFYAEGKNRQISYNEMVERILECVRSGLRTCVAAYGHPGVFAYPTHEAIRLARIEGYSAKMLPGISAEDCLFADLGIDPSKTGCQSYEATDFLKSRRRIDPTSLVILWQIGVIGNITYEAKGYDLSALHILVERLYEFYSPDHHVFVYEAAIYFGGEPMIKRMPLRALADSEFPTMATLCIPPGQATTPDIEMYSRLNIPLPDGECR